MSVTSLNNRSTIKLPGPAGYNNLDLEVGLPEDNFVGQIQMAYSALVVDLKLHYYLLLGELMDVEGLKE